MQESGGCRGWGACRGGCMGPGRWQVSYTLVKCAILCGEGERQGCLAKMGGN
jgi:hypothetical protein